MLHVSPIEAKKPMLLANLVRYTLLHTLRHHEFASEFTACLF